LIALLTSVVDGEIAYCSGAERKPISLRPPPDTSIESLFTSVQVPRYILDLRNAPPSISTWLRQPQDHWNGFGITRLSIANAFDIVYFVSPVRPACPLPQGIRQSS
jgi:hypothetical protein